jgi:hypothetical protein
VSLLSKKAISASERFVVAQGVFVSYIPFLDEFWRKIIQEL